MEENINEIEIVYETEEETKELSYKIFDFFYLPEISEELKLNNFKDIIDEIISSIKTKKDAENVFGQIFEIFNEYESENDLLKIKKSFLLALKIFITPKKGFKIFSTVIGNNSSYFDDFIDKNQIKLIEEDHEIINIYDEINSMFEKYREKIENIKKLPKPKPSLIIRQSIIKMENQPSNTDHISNDNINKDFNILHDQHKEQILLDEKEDVILETDENHEKSRDEIIENFDEDKFVLDKFSIEKQITLPIKISDDKNVIEISSKIKHSIQNNSNKKNYFTSDELLDVIQNTDKKLNEVISDSEYLSDGLQEDLNKIENTISNSQINNRESRSKSLVQSIADMNTKKLIEDVNYIEEREIENGNIIYSGIQDSLYNLARKSLKENNRERNINFISLNLILQYIINDTAAEKFKTDISKALVMQHTVIINSNNFLELIKSILLKFVIQGQFSSFPKGITNLIDNFLRFCYNEVIFSNCKIIEKLNTLYEIIESKQSEILLPKNDCLQNNLIKIKIRDIIEFLKFSKDNDVDLQENLGKLKKLLNPLSESYESKVNIISDFPSPILPIKEREFFDILDWSEVEVARQLTLVTFHIFSKIETKELLNSQWTKVDKQTTAPNVTKLIERFNRLVLWVCEEILAFDKSKYRAQAIEKFIKLASELKKINNYNDCVVIVTALHSIYVKNLAKSWRRISFEGVKTCKELNNLCSYVKNYAALRVQIENCEGSCIPYLGYFLKELAFIDEGPKYTREPNLINIEKIKRVQKVIDNVKRFQLQGYNFRPVFKLGFLGDVTPLSEQELSLLSESLEPKFTLYKNKSPYKRWTSTDINSKNLSPNFNEFVNSINKTKTTVSLKERIKMHFNKDNLKLGLNQKN